MTWGKALPILIVAGLFDAIRMFFELFWFFGPALAAVACTAAVSSTSVGGVVGTTITGGVCTAAAAAVGVYGSGAIEAFGILMSMVFGFLGFLTLGLLLLKNARIFIANTTGTLWFLGSFALSEIPFLGALPAFTLTLLKLYRTQIRFDSKALRAFENKLRAARIQEEQQQVEQQQAMAAANEQHVQNEANAQAERDARTDEALAHYQEQEVGNDPRYIPERDKLAV